MKGTKSAAIMAALSLISTKVEAQDLGSLSECMTGEDAIVRDISSIDWSASYELTLDPGDSCYHTTFSTSYAWWHESQAITTKMQTYRHPAGSETECISSETNIDYYAGTVLYTSQSPWPYDEPDICAWVYVFTNDN